MLWSFVSSCGCESLLLLGRDNLVVGSCCLCGSVDIFLCVLSIYTSLCFPSSTRCVNYQFVHRVHGIVRNIQRCISLENTRVFPRVFGSR